MLPQVIADNTVQPFKFWFYDGLQDGVHFNNELYYRLKQTTADGRGPLYQLGCKLARQGADVIVTVGPDDCSLWANLRNQKVAASTFSEKLALPSADVLLDSRPSA